MDPRSAQQNDSPVCEPDGDMREQTYRQTYIHTDRQTDRQTYTTTNYFIVLKSIKLNRIMVNVQPKQCIHCVTV